MEKEKDRETQIGKALLKVALGFQVAEVTEEYAEVDGALKLTKRKRTKKDVPPDLKAVQLLLSGQGERLEEMSDEELQKEKTRLLAELNEEEKKALGLIESAGQVCVERTKVTAKTPKGRGKANKKGEEKV